MYSPRLDTRPIAERFDLRRLDLDTPEQQARRAAREKVKYPGPKPRPDPDQSSGKPTVLRQVAKAPKGPQTLVQPDLDKKITLAQEVPVPTLMIWTPKKTVVKNIVAPQPEKPTAANVTPSLAPPINEVNLASISIATSAVPAPKLLTLPSTTSPVVVQGPEVQLAPASVSQVSARPTPAAVMSLSDLTMARGSVVLPPVNETAANNSPGPLAPGEAQDRSARGNSNKAGKGGSGQNADGGGDPPGDTGARNGAASSPAQGANVGQSNQPSATKITLPKDGQFGAVVVGASLVEQYPEIVRVWGSRLAYTVYLHVGTARSWVLQYSIPRTDEAAAAGNIAHLEAPWPYNIVRPNLTADPDDVNTIIVHGYVNQAGRFESLNIVFPAQFPLAQFVLASLQKWQFRPAARNGQVAKVEVLLIIPEEMQ
ncbi:MAG TPA: hypothetical protein VGT08_01765 [Terracidiphilus sp.]|nr:hypothetical protein [Terracidiphilus sp.]